MTGLAWAVVGVPASLLITTTVSPPSGQPTWQVIVQYIGGAAVTGLFGLAALALGRRRKASFADERDKYILRLEHDLAATEQRHQAEMAARDRRITALESRGDRLGDRITEMSELHPDDPKRKDVE